MPIEDDEASMLAALAMYVTGASNPEPGTIAITATAVHKKRLPGVQT